MDYFNSKSTPMYNVVYSIPEAELGRSSVIELHAITFRAAEGAHRVRIRCVCVSETLYSLTAPRGQDKYTVF